MKAVSWPKWILDIKITINEKKFNENLQNKIGIYCIHCTE